MLYGKIHVGNDAATSARWDRDALPKCHNDDAMWGFVFRSSEVLERERGKINDPVLYRLLRIGVLDQSGVNGFQSQALQAVQWVSATCVHLFQRILKVETQVHHSGRLLLTKADRTMFYRLIILRLTHVES